MCDNDCKCKKDETSDLSRRDFLENMGKAGLGLATATLLPGFLTACDQNKVEEFFQKHFTELSPAEVKKVIARLESENSKKFGKDVKISTTPAIPGVLFGYGLDISRCVGCRRCVHACVKENNQGRDPEIQWIKVLEMPKEKGVNLEEANAYYCINKAETKLTEGQKKILADVESQYPLYDHKATESECGVPNPDNFYLPVACQQCENPPCVKVCPVQATWKEPDGIVVVDYNWCIGCRYCMAACPYGARHFNWTQPTLPAEDLNTNMHYLGNRPRPQGVVEKCTFCVQRSREGRYPACVEVCPVGSRKFGNMLDPKSEIRTIMETKRVFILKSELNTKPKFFYFYGL